MPFSLPRLVAPLALSVLLATSTGVSQVPGFRFDSTVAEAQFGYATAGAGDVDGDGFDDLVVGLPGARNTEGSIRAGLVCVYSGVDLALLYAFEGESPDDRFGHSVRTAGDVDADGHADIIIGGPGGVFEAAALPGRERGVARVISGADGSLLWEFTGTVADESFGYAVASAGDVDADGHGDVIIGACEADAGPLVDAGAAVVRSGRTGQILHTVRGDGPGWHFGWCVCAAGDLDGDGYDDFATGSPFAPDPVTSLPAAGRLRVYSGFDGRVLREYRGNGNPADQFATSACMFGDVTGDGIKELVVGAPGDDGAGLDAGAVFVFDGATGATLYTIGGRAPGDLTGFSVDSAGDVDADGIKDVIFGEPGFDAQGASATGGVRIVRGSDGQLLRAVDGEISGDNFGWSVAYAGDTDADGFYDVLVGAPSADTLAQNAGRAWLLQDVTRVPTMERIYGTACVGGQDRIPRAGYIGRASIGTTIHFTLRGASPLNPLCGLAVGLATELPLDVIGAVGCTLYTDPFVIVQVVADATGRADVPVLIADDPGLFGVDIDVQWILVDTEAPRALPVALSDAVKVTYGT